MSGADVSELSALAADLLGAANVEVKKSVQQTALTVKNFWRDDAKRSFPKRIASRYAPTINYSDVKRLPDNTATYHSEIGPNLKRYGGLTGKGGLIPSMGILEDAGGQIKSRPRNAVVRADKFAQKEFSDRMQLALDEALKKRGLL